MTQQRPPRRNGPPTVQATPPPGWESGVWARLGRERWRRRALGVLMVLAALGLGTSAALLLRHTRPGNRGRIESRVEGALRPDGSAAPGRTWQLLFDGAELRVYRNGLPWGERCPGGSGCTGGARQALRLPLEGPGEYRAVAFPRPGPEAGTLHDDVTRARAQGQDVALSEPLIVY